MNKLLGTIFFSILMLGIYRCSPSEEANLQEKVSLDIPEEFVPMVIPNDNILDSKIVSLGRLLFYDPILSMDSTVACASCHFQQLAFTDGRKTSVGILGKKGRRSSMSLANVGFYYKGLFWDGRSITLEEQVTHPITDTLEMGNIWEKVIAKLASNTLYTEKFKLAFPSSSNQKITKDNIAKALAQFQRTFISADSKYDQVLRGEAVFSDAEWRGMEIFFDKSDTLPVSECGHCHTDPLFTNLDFENNGIDMLDTIKTDEGRKMISGRTYDLGKFRIPSLRNIAVTAPYMHDGRFATLEEVIEHYNRGGHEGVNVSPNVMPLHLGKRDKADLVAFLKTLTDSTFLKKEELSNPFL